MTISLRLAQKKDLLPIFNLANEDLVRQNSFKPDKIKLAGHTRWFLNKLKDKNTMVLIAEEDKRFVGQIRFDFGQENVIGISISKAYRGRGLSPILIAQGLKYLQKTRPKIKIITAYIKTDNIVSVKTFEKVGFKFDQKLKVDKNNALRYIYNLNNSERNNALS